MNLKVLLAFAAGVALTGGVAYFATRQHAPAPVASATVEQPKAVTVEPAAQPAPSSVGAANAAGAASPVEAPPAAAKAPAVRPVSKPSPVKTAQSTPRPEKPEVRPAQTYVVKPEPAAESQPAPQPPAVEVRKAEPVPAPVAAPPPPVAPPPPARVPHTVTVANGTLLTVRLSETLSTERNRAGDTFSATLDQPLVVDGFVIAERGARVQGRVVESDRSGRVKGVAQMGVELTQLTTADGQKIRLNTTAFQKQAESERKKDAAKVGLGAALGAAIGAIAGGGKGAGIGAGVGGAAGAGDVLLTRGKPVEFPVEMRLTFRLAEPVTITEKLR